MYKLEMDKLQMYTLFFWGGGGVEFNGYTNIGVYNLYYTALSVSVTVRLSRDTGETSENLYKMTTYTLRLQIIIRLEKHSIFQVQDFINSHILNPSIVFF